MHRHRPEKLPIVMQSSLQRSNKNGMTFSRHRMATGCRPRHVCQPQTKNRSGLFSSVQVHRVRSQRNRWRTRNGFGTTVQSSNFGRNKGTSSDGCCKTRPSNRTLLLSLIKSLCLSRESFDAVTQPTKAMSYRDSSFLLSRVRIGSHFNTVADAWKWQSQSSLHRIR